MYKHTYKEIVIYGLTEKIIDPILMGKDGNDCDAERCFGYMVKYNILHLDQCLIGYKVDGSISMKGDAHVGVSLLRNAHNSIAYGQISISDFQKNALIVLTALDGTRVIYIRVKSDGDS